MKSYLIAIANAPAKLSAKWQLTLIATFCFISTGFYLPIHSQDHHLKQSTSDSIDTSSKKSEKLLSLIESLVNLLEPKRYQIESELELSATQGALSFTMLINTKTIVESQKFVSEIDFISPNGTIGKRYKVVSDGKSTWIYDINKKIYSVSNYQNFIDSNDAFLLGLLSSFTLYMKEDKKFISGISDFRQLSEFQKLQYINKSLDERKIDIDSIDFKNDLIQGKYYEGINILIPKDNINFSIFIDPQTLNIKGLHLLGQEEDMTLDFKEQIIRQTIPISTSSYIFRFIPPLEVKKVAEQISIKP